MPAPRQNYYDLLGIPRTAKVTDVGRAYKRHKSDMRKEDAAPDARRAALLDEAYETLSDPDRRAAYDASLVATVRRKGTRGAAVWGSAIVLGTVATVAAYFALRPLPERPTGARSMEDIASAASLAVGRVQRLDISGNATPIGLAFAIDDGVMVTSCHGVSPTAQLVVNLAPRLSPARVAAVDERLGLCKLAAEGVGSRPLTMSGAMPRAGETVYATRVNAVGEVALIEGRVKRIVAEPNGNVIEATIPVVPERAGGPLLDVYGRVVAVASFSHADGQGRNMAMPAAWIADTSALRSAPPAAAPATPAAATSSATESTRIPKSAKDIPPERLEKLEKAFRPPPTVPDEL